jgi:hypothetical protein
MSERDCVLLSKVFMTFKRFASWIMLYPHHSIEGLGVGRQVHCCKAYKCRLHNDAVYMHGSDLDYKSE